MRAYFPELLMDGMGIPWYHDTIGGKNMNDEHERIRKKRQDVKVNRICRIYNVNIVSDIKTNRKANMQQNITINHNMPQ